MDLIFIGVFVGLVMLLAGMVEGCDRLVTRGYAGLQKNGSAQTNGSKY